MNSTRSNSADDSAYPPSPLSAALFYIGNGWPVLPLHTPLPILVASGPGAGEATFVCDCDESVKARGKCTPGKHPRVDLVPHAVRDATLDPDLARQWWDTYPHANVGVDLWRAGLIDIAPDSAVWQAEFLARNYSEGVGDPTLVFASGGGDGHEHWLYRRSRDMDRATNVNRPGEYDVLVRGYAVMPPSLHESGRHYRWVKGIGQ